MRPCSERITPRHRAHRGLRVRPQPIRELVQRRKEKKQQRSKAEKAVLKAKNQKLKAQCVQHVGWSSMRLLPCVLCMTMRASLLVALTQPHVRIRGRPH